MTKSRKIFSCSCHNIEERNSSDVDFEKCFNWFNNFAKSKNLHPTHLGISGKGFNGKIIPFDNGLKMLFENKFNNLSTVNIYVSKSSSLDLAFYWDMLFSISCSPILGTRLYLGIDSEIVKFSDLIVREISKVCCKLIDPIIGYFYLSSPEDGPFAYSFGAIHTPKNDYLTEDSKAVILEWSRNEDLVKEGKLRDLYQFNILSHFQLNYEIDGDSLKNWVLTNKERGTFFEVSPNHILWEIPISNYHIIRNQLFLAKMLISYDKYLMPTDLYKDY